MENAAPDSLVPPSNNVKENVRKEVTPAFLGMLVLAVVVYCVMSAVQPMLMNNAILPGFGETLVGCIEGSPASKLYWFVLDFSQTTFLASVPATVCMIAGALIAARLEMAGSSAAGTGVDGNGRIYARLVLANICSVGLGLLFFGNLYPGFTGWIPTFAVLLVVQPLLTQFGVAPAKLITGTFVCTLVTFPVTYLIQNYIVAPIGVPLFVAVSMAVVVVVPPLAALFRSLKWMNTPIPESDAPEAPPAPSSPTNFFVNRVFGDVSELSVSGSSISSIAMYIGAIVAWCCNPLEPAYGAGNLPLLIASQIAVSALSIYVYYPKWKQGGFVFTFAGIVFVSAIVGGYCATGTAADFIIAIPTILVGSVIFVPIIDWVMKAFKFDGSYPAIALIQLGICPVVIVWALLISHVVLPLL